MHLSLIQQLYQVINRIKTYLNLINSSCSSPEVMKQGYESRYICWWNQPYLIILLIIDLFHLSIKMAQTQKMNKQYDQYKKIIAQFPLKCRMYLTLLIGLHDEQFNHQIPKALRKNYQIFTNIFKKLTPEQRLFFIGKNIEFAASRLKMQVGQKQRQIQQIETSCEIKGSFIGLSFWEKRMFKYEFKHFLIRLSTSKKTEVIQLKNYLIRRSLSEKYTFVLEAVEPNVGQNKQKIFIKFGNLSIYQQIYNNVRYSIIELSNKRIQVLLREELKDNPESKFQDQVIIKGLTFLTSKIINEYFSQKVEIIKKLKTKSYTSDIIYVKGDIRMRNSMESSKYYFLDYILPKEVDSMEAVKESVNIIGHKTMVNRYYSQKLESFTPNISAKYYKFTVDPHECESIMIVQTLERQGKFQQIMKSTENIFSGINIPFINIEVQRGEDKRYVLFLSAIIKSNTKYRHKNKDIVQLLFAMISSNQRAQVDTSNQTITPKHKSNEQIPRKRQHQSEIPYTARKSINPSIDQSSKVQKRSSNEQDQVFYSIQNLDQQDQNVQQALNKCSAKNVIVPTHDIDLQMIRKQSHSHISYLDAKPFLVPSKQPEKRYITQSSLLKDFKKLPKGGVVCVNQEVIAEQKKIFKLICKQFGSKLFKMQGVMSFSLPVQICKPESTLISIAKNIAYSPLLFQNHTALTPLQKIRNTMIFQISMATISLTTKTPLNPIVGQTYQGSIHGCPIYLQQLSHHPAVSYLLFMGRGFKLYGGVAPTICIRLNYVKGVNPKWITVQFDDGHKIQFSQPTMIINGMLFGDRNIYFDSTNYILDVKNNFIAEVVFNAGEKGFFSSKQSPDYLTGHIYQTTPQFIEDFIASKKTLSPKKDQRNKLITVISGEWNGVLTADNQTIFNFQTKMPLQLQNYQHPLMSDSIYRTDAIQILGGIMDRAQEQKERLEQLQRKDKRMREAFMKSMKKK